MSNHNPWALMGSVRGRIYLAMFCSGVSSLSLLLSMVFLAASLTSLMTSPNVWPWAPMLGALIATIATFCFRILSFDISHFAAFRLEAELRLKLSRRIAYLPLGKAQSIGSATLSKILTEDVRALHVFVADSTPLYARAFAMPLMTMVFLPLLDWRLALTALAILAFGFGVLAYAMRDFRPMIAQYHNAREQVSRAIVEFVQAMPTVRIFDEGHTTFGRFQTALEEYLEFITEWYRRSAFSARFSMAVMNMLPTLVALIVVGLWLQSSSQLEFSTWLLVLLLAAGTAEAMLPMMMLSQLNEKAKISVARIQDILELPLQAVPPADAALSPKDASVAFEAVRFGYAPVQNALQNVSFKAAAGEVTALVGASGAGKSTIANLITRSWEVDGGKVLIGGVDVRDLTTDQLTQQVATVFQHSFLFSLSLRENICLGIETVSEADLIAAAKAAQIFDFICTLPHGFDTQAGERGLFLSGGQRQRITIARAILQDRPILILDEATAHSDPQNEVQIFAALSHLTKGRTVIVITHRLRTIQAADKIVVLDQGKVVETGHHAALLKRAGTYARLWQAQQIADQWQVKSKGAADA